MSIKSNSKICVNNTFIKQVIQPVLQCKVCAIHLNLNGFFLCALNKQNETGICKEGTYVISKHLFVSSARCHKQNNLISAFQTTRLSIWPPNYGCTSAKSPLKFKGKFRIFITYYTFSYLHPFPTPTFSPSLLLCFLL